MSKKEKLYEYFLRNKHKAPLLLSSELAEHLGYYSKKELTQAVKRFLPDWDLGLELYVTGKGRGAITMVRRK